MPLMPCDSSNVAALSRMKSASTSIEGTADRDVRGREKCFFSIVIPAWNRGGLIRPTLDSVVSQRETSYEIIVVDDGSTDETSQVLAEYAARLKVVSQPNAGPGAARNRGAEAACGRYLVFLDSDDLWFPWTLTVLREAIEKYHPVSLLTSNPHEFTHPCELSVLEEEPRIERFDDLYASAGEFRFVGSGAMVVARETFLRAGGFTTDVRVAEDLDLSLRLGIEPNYLYVAAPPLLGYRRHSESQVSGLDRLIEGVEYLIDQEQAGKYPGGRERRPERIKMLARFTRSASLMALRGSRVREGVNLYRRTLALNLALGRVKYLAAFPLLAAAALTHEIRRNN